MAGKTTVSADARRRGRLRWRYAGLAAIGHVALVALLNALTPQTPIPFAVGAIDLSLISGSGAGATSLPAAPSARSARSVDPATAEVDSPEPEPEPTPSTSETAVEPTPPVPLTQPSASAPTASEPSTDDVLAEVRSLVGEDGTAATTDASPAGAAVAGQPGGGSKCEAGAAVLDELLHDEKALAALERLPRESLSVAGAVQLWDGASWVDERSVGGVGSTLPIRQAVVRAIDNSPAECLSMIFRGPRFLVVPVRAGPPVTVVIGSGEWRWADALIHSGVPSKADDQRWFGIVPTDSRLLFPATRAEDGE